MTNGMAVKNAWCVKGVTSNRLLLGMTGATQGTAQRKLDRMLANIADEDPTLPEDERGGPIMGETQYVVVPITIWVPIEANVTRTSVRRIFRLPNRVKSP